MEERPIEGPGAPHPALAAPDLPPEARRLHALRWQQGLEKGVEGEVEAHYHPITRAQQVLGRTLAGVWNDGFIHAGNLAYMAVVALFPFFIVATAIFSAIGERGQREAALNAVLLAVPHSVATAIAPVAHDVIEARTGKLLWIGGLVGLWTVGSLVETIREVLRRAYGTRATQAFWRYRLSSTALIFAAMVLLLLSLLAQVAIGAVEQALHAWVPRLDPDFGDVVMTRLIPAGVLFGSLYLLFYSLTPGRYRSRAYPKWPGALFVTAWWVLVTLALPWVLRGLFNYDLTYGSLAGIMITLFFFWLVGLGMVFGAELNAALAETPEERVMVDQADSRHRPARQEDGGD